MGWISKIDENGNILWQTEFNSRALTGVQELRSGAFLLLGSSLESDYQYGPELYLTKLSASGTVIRDEALTP
ncbi:MAG: hypothetical protein U5N26_02935 [Candidatus Marinimicrobia bacterium]|nr:hypothetical protein [Candidatus Neomarinimicrobiota bacterium]